MIRNLGKVSVVLFLCVTGIGFARGWFSLSTRNSEPDSRKVNINLTVDRDKVEQDAQTLQQKTAELAGKAKDEAKELRDQIHPKS